MRSDHPDHDADALAILVDALGKHRANLGIRKDSNRCGRLRQHLRCSNGSGDGEAAQRSGLDHGRAGEHIPYHDRLTARAALFDSQPWAASFGGDDHYETEGSFPGVEDDNDQGIACSEIPCYSCRGPVDYALNPIGPLVRL